MTRRKGENILLGLFSDPINGPRPIEIVKNHSKPLNRSKNTHPFDEICAEIQS